MKGYTGKILRVNLTTGTIIKNDLDQSLAREYLGGRGFVARILWDELSPGINPLSPENIFICATGVLSGHKLVAGNRTIFGCKSPLTNGYADSMMGGYFSPELKFAGYDMIVFKGASDKPVYLYIHDDDVELRNASEYWGKGAIDTEKLLKKELGTRFQIASVGPAAENRVKYACITHNEGRNSGRMGCGTVMGLKKLKSIAIRGTNRDLDVHDPEKLKELRSDAVKEIRAGTIYPTFKSYGTTMVIPWTNEVGIFPNRNFQYGVYDRWEDISGEAQRQYLIQDRACYGCPCQCWMMVDIKKYGIQTHFTEYEASGLIGGNLELIHVNDLQYANYLCNNLGIDTISTGSCIGFAIECFKKGIITKEEIDGLELRFGDADLVYKLQHMIAYRKGIGDVLAEGTRYAAMKWGSGSIDFAMQVKGAEVSAYDCRATPAMALSFMTADIGAHHNRSWASQRDVNMGREKLEGKPEVVVDLQHRRPLLDQLGVCRFPWIEAGMDYNYYTKFYNAVTGANYTTEELLKYAERVWNLTRAFWIREFPDFGRNWDQPPKRWFQPTDQGPVKGMHLTQEMVDWLLNRYYELRGWTKNGIPTREKLKELGLIAVATELEKLSRL